jgi:hypothetical protein
VKRCASVTLSAIAGLVPCMLRCTSTPSMARRNGPS